MNYKDFYHYLVERYAGSKKLRGIWYHGTSTKYLPSILSQGLIPNPKELSWDSDKDASQVTFDRTTYGGIYVTKNLMTAYSAAWRTAKKTKGNRLIVILDLQSKSLIADEDDIVFHLRQYPESIALWYFKVLKYPTTDIDRYYQSELEKEKENWATSVMSKFIVHYDINNPRVQETLKSYLKNEGFLASLTRTVAYTNDKYLWHRSWDYRKVDSENIPPLPSKQEGESIFRSFVSKLTAMLKELTRKDTFSPKGRSLRPIRFTGSNKIICIVELIENPNEPTKLKLHYGSLPADFINQYKERFGDINNINDLIIK